MLSISRKNEIRNIVVKNGNIIVAELAEQFQTSEETIRKDLKQLEDEGVLRRVYGGAVYIDSAKSADAQLREKLFIEDKELIADISMSYIKNNESIFLDGSTTAYCLAKRLINKKITVVTNSLLIADLFSTSNTVVNLVMIGGQYDSKRKVFLGQTSELCLKQYFFDKAFISCEAIHLEHGITDSSEAHALIRRLAISQAHDAYLIVDHTKFDKSSLSFIAELSAIRTLITNRPLLNKWTSTLDSLKISYDFPKPEKKVDRQDNNAIEIESKL